MSKPQHFKTMSTDTMPAASSLSGALDLGWDVVSIVASPRGGFTTYFKRVAVQEPRE
jgi:hypothetical protein